MLSFSIIFHSFKFNISLAHLFVWFFPSFSISFYFIIIFHSLLVNYVFFTYSLISLFPFFIISIFQAFFLQPLTFFLIESSYLFYSSLLIPSNLYMFSFSSAPFSFFANSKLSSSQSKFSFSLTRSRSVTTDDTMLVSGWNRSREMHTLVHKDKIEVSR